MLAKADLDELAKIQGETEEYLACHDVLRQGLQDMYWGFRALGDLIPQTGMKPFSGHFFPYSQAEHELQSSTALAD